MFTNKGNETKDYIEILDKMLELEKRKESPNAVKITICIVGGLGSIMFIAILCYAVLRSNISVENILSILLAFFSIFISIFFYFKADETSTDFYNSSYEFMKDISVTLGKIEERFGEKLNSLNDKISHLDKISSEANKEIKDKKDDKDSLINDLMDKANLNKEERKKYKEELAKKDAEIEMLKNHKFQVEREAAILRGRINESKEKNENIPIPSRRFLNNLLETHDTSDCSIRWIYNLKKLGIIDKNGEIDDEVILKILKGEYV